MLKLHTHNVLLKNILSFPVKMVKYCIIFLFTSTITVASATSLKDIRSQAEKLIGAKNLSSVRLLKESGMYEIQMVDGSFLYMSPDTKYFIVGDMYKNVNPNPVNLSEVSRSKTRKSIVKRLDNFGNENLIVYKAKRKEKAFIYVFTDPYCPYCKKFHNEVLPELQKSGISVKYILFPVIRVNSKQMSMAVWCSPDRNKSLNDAFRGVDLLDGVTTPQCKNPLDENIKIARILAVRGTPFILFKDGKSIGGFVQASKIKAKLNIK